MLELGLTDATFRAKLASLRRRARARRPREWTRRIVVDRANWPLSFHRWPLRDDHGDRGGHSSRSANWACPGPATSPSTPTIRCCRTSRASRSSSPGRRARTSFRSASRSQPDPRQHPGLARFTAQIVSEDSGPTGAVASVKPATTGRTGYKVTFRKLRGAGLEPGWHYVRVLPQDRRRESRSRSSLRTTAGHASRTRASASSSSRTGRGRRRPGRHARRPTRPRSMPGVTQALRVLSSRRSARAATGGPSSADRSTGRARRTPDATRCVPRSARMAPRRSRFHPCSRTSSGRLLADPARAPCRWTDAGGRVERQPRPVPA